MPEGDTIHRAARTLHAALGGQRIERFESVLAHLVRVDADTPIAGRVLERVEARGKHVLMWIEGGLVLRTHMRMHGSWHIWPASAARRQQLQLARDSISSPRFAGRSSRGRWQRRRHDIRIVIETASYIAAAIAVPVAEFVEAHALDREGPVAELGPDVLSDGFDAAKAVARLEARGDMDIADALLDQRALAGIGNVFKSEILFAARVSPFTPVRDLDEATLTRIVTIARRQMRANVSDSAEPGAGGRRTTNRLDPSARLWVYGRRGQPCRRCGAPIQRVKQGPDARSTYWCERCQQPRLTA